MRVTVLSNWRDGSIRVLVGVDKLGELNTYPEDLLQDMRAGRVDAMGPLENHNAQAAALTNLLMRLGHQVVFAVLT